MMDNQSDLFEAIKARDEALEQVELNSKEWFQEALRILPTLRIIPPFTGEDIKHHIIDHVGRPHHSNVFGALINSAVRKGMIEHFGWDQCRDKTSHARWLKTYVWPA